MAGELGELWENSSPTDCCPVVADPEFRSQGHLSSSLSSSQSLVGHDVEESRKNGVETHDLELQVKAMMGFLYTRKAPGTRQHGSCCAGSC